MEKCSKCLQEETFLVKYTDTQETWNLCKWCHRAFDIQGDLMREFMKEDFGRFPVNKITGDIILARLKRNKGESPWEQRELINKTII